MAAVEDVYRVTVPHRCVVTIYAPDGEFHRRVSEYTFEGWIPPLPADNDCVTYWDTQLEAQGEDGTSWGWRSSLSWEFTAVGVEITVHLNDEPSRKKGQ